MKKYIFAITAFTALLFASCSNDDIEIETSEDINDVSVTVSLSDFFSSYNFTDTQHDINVQEKSYRTFNSESGLYIQVRTLFYNSRGNLVDSLLTYSSNTNAVTQNTKLAEGQYTAITTLTFAYKTTSGDYRSYWWALTDKDKLSTAKLSEQSRSRWSILSYEAKTITVTPESTTTLTMSPSPVGSLVYMYFQNFQYENESSYGTVTDNDIRRLSLFGRNLATDFVLNPDASEKYIYRDDAGSDSWWYLYSFEPSDFDDDWTYFQSNLYSFFHLLSPNPTIIFGYELDGENYFHPYGEGTYNIQNGKTYLAYWDYFQVGNPYFGIADNNHWNTYSSEVKALAPAKRFGTLAQ